MSHYETGIVPELLRTGNNYSNMIWKYDERETVSFCNHQGCKNLALIMTRRRIPTDWATSTNTWDGGVRGDVLETKPRLIYLNYNSNSNSFHQRLYNGTSKE